MAEETKKEEMKKKEPEAFLLRYHGLNLHYFSFPGQEIAKKFVYGGQFCFFPGINRVFKKEWDLLKGNPLFNNLIDSGKITFIGGKNPDEKGATSSDLSEYSANESISIVKNTVDFKLLSEWMAAERRGDVAAALDSQLDEVGPVKKAVNE